MRTYRKQRASRAFGAGKALLAATLLAAALALLACSAAGGEAGAGSSAAAPTPNGETATYRTRLFEQLGQPGPSLTFEYPDGWRVVAETCRPQMFTEHVVLESDSGRQISLTVGSGIPSTSGYTTDALADIDFNPEPYPSPEIPESVSEYERRSQTDDEVRSLKLQVRRWERPEQLGEGCGYYVTDADGNDPYYYGFIQFMCLDLASQGNMEFSPDEEREVLQILSSLRQEPAPCDEQLVADMTAAYRAVPGVYLDGGDDGEGGIYLDIWQLDENGDASNMGRMSKWDYTWRLSGGQDSLGRMLVLLEPADDNPVQAPRVLAYDSSLDALCEPDEPEAKFTR